MKALPSIAFNDFSGTAGGIPTSAGRNEHGNAKEGERSEGCRSPQSERTPAQG